MFVYMTICLLNNKKYIGKCEQQETSDYLGSGKLIRRAISKYGKENFHKIILERYSTREECCIGEKMWIDRFNACNSDEFYNIAEGGCGGNTYKGILGNDRLVLLDKLKNRSNLGKHLRNRDTISVVDLCTGVAKLVEPAELYRPNHVGVACKGIYISPFGNFSSLKALSKIFPGEHIDMYSFSRRCKLNNRIIKISHLQNIHTQSMYYIHTKNNIGKTFKEAGYDLIPISELIGKDLDFYKKFNIIKVN